jgi:lysyl-tRNA synthetase, class II
MSNEDPSLSQTPVVDSNEQILQRKEKLAALRAKGNAFPNDFRRDALAQEIFANYAEKEPDFFAANKIPVKIAGRMMTRRIMGKASFIHLQDMSGKIQVYLKRDDLSEGKYDEFKDYDLGDIVGVCGTVFKTKTGELSVKATDIRLLTKSLRPLPEKFHGLVDHETCHRQRYLDLIANPETRKRFYIRSQLVAAMRQFFNEHSFLEVETPMLQAIPGGALAQPFVTHHNALDMELYLRIAPELYLKRLVVGGIERVYEINRNFRNEGISVRHNPEFTMLEFYMAYIDYHELMDFTETMLRHLAQTVLGSTKFQYQGDEFDFTQPFARMTVREAILHFNPHIKEHELDDIDLARKVAEQLQIPVDEQYGLGKIQIEIFEKTVEKKLRQPTFITAYPLEVSPLARKNDQNPFLTDRFELFIGGYELANGFSELNDAEDQNERFLKQAQDLSRGTVDAMRYDADYVLALEHGLPPTSGEGMGIDRLAMLFTDSPSIRDVILFPLLKPSAQ